MSETLKDLPVQKVAGRITSWIIGPVLLLLAAGMLAGSSGLRLAGLGALIAGLFVLPPTCAYIRQKVAVPYWAPPAAALIVLVIGFCAEIPLITSKLSSAKDITLQQSIQSTPVPIPIDPEAQRVIDEYAAKDEGERFADFVESQLMARVDALSAAPSESMPEVWERLGEIEVLATKVRDGREIQMSDNQKAVLTKFETALSKKQALLLPQLRNRYRSLSKSSLWEHDIEVLGSGRLIEYVGGTFASNANIKSAHEMVSNDLLRLRFDVARYRWVRDGDGAQYKLQAPADRKIVY